MVTFWGVLVSYINDNKMWIMSKYKDKPTWVLVLALIFYLGILVSALGCRIESESHHVITEDGINWYSTEEYEDGYDTVEEPENIE